MKKWEQFEKHLCVLEKAYSEDIEETVWLEMLRDRNDATHMYNEEAAQSLVEKILNKYIAVFVRMSEGIKQRYGESLPI